MFGIVQDPILLPQVLSYIQVLWLSQTAQADDQRWNGYVEAAYTLLGEYNNIEYTFSLYKFWRLATMYGSF